jgi:hypothetical protein
MKCPVCNGTEFAHQHDSPYGLARAHMAGSERFVCNYCHRSIYASEGIPLGFKFLLDKGD